MKIAVCPKCKSSSIQIELTLSAHAPVELDENGKVITHQNTKYPYEGLELYDEPTYNFLNEKEPYYCLGCSETFDNPLVVDMVQNKDKKEEYFLATEDGKLLESEDGKRLVVDEYGCTDD